MSAKLSFALVIHNHQPCGNLPEMFETAYAKAYWPFLDILGQLPEIKVTLHYSGALLDFFQERHPEMLQKLSELVARGQVELLGGAMYDPILSAISHRDRVEQIRFHLDRIQGQFGFRPEGMWLAERVWETHFPSAIESTGVRYVLLDDTQFEQAGFSLDALTRGFLTEDEGHRVEIYPMNTRLKAWIPACPKDFLDQLRSYATSGHSMVVLGEDGEKMGLWEGSHQRFYEQGWLRDFFTALLAQRDWLHIATLSECRELHPPRTHAYIPCSAGQAVAERGFWRHQLVCYPEIAAMQKRMSYVSRKLHSASRVSQEAFVHLWKAQTHDAYWHNRYGGAYLNFLRFEVYRNLIRAENAIEPRKYSWLEVSYNDIDSDGVDEVIAESNTMNLYFRPRSGGMLTEWDFRPRAVNLIDSFARRREPYHKGGNYRYDTYLRRSLIDHFIDNQLKLSDFVGGSYLELGDFVEGDFEASKYRNRVTLRRLGTVRGPSGIPVSVELKKSVRILPKDQKIEVEYRIVNHGDWDIITRFGTEWNFSLLASNAPDRYHRVSGQRAGHLGSTAEHREVSSASVVDEWLGLQIDFAFEGKEALLWYHPIETHVPMHFGGEPVPSYQSSVVVPLWDLDLPKGRSRRIAYSVSVSEL